MGKVIVCSMTGFILLLKEITYKGRERQKETRSRVERDKRGRHMGRGWRRRVRRERTRKAAGTLLETEEPPPEENASLSGQNSKLSSHASLLSEMYTSFFFSFSR